MGKKMTRRSSRQAKKAERKGFEPLSRIKRLPVFETGLFNHSSTFPLRCKDITPFGIIQKSTTFPQSSGRRASILKEYGYEER